MDITVCFLSYNCLVCFMGSVFVLSFVSEMDFQNQIELQLLLHSKSVVVVVLFVFLFCLKHCCLCVSNKVVVAIRGRVL